MKEFLEKVDFENNQQTKKGMQNYQVSKELKEVESAEFQLVRCSSGPTLFEKYRIN